MYRVPTESTVISKEGSLMSAWKDAMSRILVRIRICKPEHGSKDPDPSQNVTDTEHCSRDFRQRKNTD
jgi:hypothetical protein